MLAAISCVCDQRLLHPSSWLGFLTCLTTLVLLLCLQVLINGATLGVSLVVALFTPGGAEKVYSIVGATGAAALHWLFLMGYVFEVSDSMGCVFEVSDGC